jgi:hypothetical protein
MVYTFSGQFEKGEEIALEVQAFAQEFGYELFEVPNSGLLGLIQFGKGGLSEGQLNEFLEQTEGKLQYLLAAGYTWVTIPFHSGLGQVYGILEGVVPNAKDKAVEHFKAAIEIAKEIGARPGMARAYLDMGLMHMAHSEKEQARECFYSAAQLFEQCELENMLKQSRDALASLD